MLLRKIAAGLLPVLLVAPALADGPNKPQEALDLSTIITSMAAAGAGEAADASDQALPKFEDVTKDMKSQEGLFTLWSYPADAKDKDSEKLLCEIPRSFLGEKFMLSTSFSGGGFFTGFPLDERAVQWELLDKQLLLIEPESRYVVDPKSAVSDVVSRTYPERIRAAVPVVCFSPAGNPVIDLGALLKSDFADIGWMSMTGAAGINPSLSKWTKKKAFELNVEIGVELAMHDMYPPGSYDKKMVHYSFWKLPKSDYQPRVADDRVGYFLTANQDWGKPTSSRDLFNRYIDRWNLKKRDPSLDKCEPIQPIVFYIEKTVPVRFRRAVRDGILEWNKAFEAVGFIDAVQVRQQTDDNEWKDLDPEDMRYSFFRWIVTGGGFAMGPHRSNPFTGEIYDADIVFDDSMVRFYEQEARRSLPSAMAYQKLRDPLIQQFLDKFPQWNRPTRDWEQFSYIDPEENELVQRARLRMHERGQHLCDYAEGMQHQMAVASTVLAGQPPEVIDQFLHDTIKEVVMHEVGHTLGLRHNFKGSTVWTLEEIQDRRKEGKATTGSVMDYNPALLFKDHATEGAFITPTIGPYDYWAIEYGYRPADGKYKAPNAPDDAVEEETEVEETETVAGTDGHSGSVNVNDLPEDVLEKLPPEVRKLIESGAVQAAMGGHGSDNGKKKPGGSAFKGANANEQGMLMAIASRAAEPELAYATDEDTTWLSPDPRSNRFDCSADPIDWAQSRIDLVNNRMENIMNWAVDDEESWYFLRTAFLNLMMEKAIVMDYVGRYVGGIYTSRSHRGDPDGEVPFVLVDPDTQRKALKFIEDNLFNDAFHTYSPELLNHLAVPRWWHEGTSISFSVDFPIHDYIALMQWWNLFDRLSPNTFRRIYDAELKTDSDNKLTLAEYLQRTQNACWDGTADAARAKKGAWTDAKPFVSSIRRSLQREYLNLMEPLVRTAPGQVISPDIHAMVQFSLQKLNNQIGEALDTGKLDFASEAHLTACKSRIDRMLAPDLTEYGMR